MATLPLKLERINHDGHKGHDEPIGADNPTNATYPSPVTVITLRPVKQADVPLVPVVVQLL